MAQSLIRTADNFISNEYVPPKNKKYLDVICPHDETLIGKVALSTKEDVEEAVTQAHSAYLKWSKWTVKERMRCLLKLRAIVEEKELELASIVIREHGKNKAEALGSIRKGNETVEYACSMPQLVSGKCLEVSNGVECTEYRLPHGVVVSIVPFNFPIMVPLWTMPIAVACGNTFILKPSEKVPLTMNKFCEYVKEAGFPPGVFQVVNGQAEAVNGLIDHPLVKAVSFVGSSRVAEMVYNRCKTMSPPKRCLALGGAKNHLVAAPDCNVSMTAQDVVNSYTGCTGQRCMAASVLLMVGEQKKLLEEICIKSMALKPGTDSRDLGPVIDAQARDRIIDYINKAEADGHQILVDGRPWAKENTKGFWVGPTVILFGDPKHPAMTEEIFGPVLSIYVCENREEAIAIENANCHGNAACIYTTTGETAEWFSKRFSAGMIGVNVGVPVPREPFSFGGTNRSKFGDCDITADAGIEFWTYRKKVTTKWAPPEKKTWMD